MSISHAKRIEGQRTRNLVKSEMERCKAAGEKLDVEWLANSLELQGEWIRKILRSLRCPASVYVRERRGAETRRAIMEAAASIEPRLRNHAWRLAVAERLGCNVTTVRRTLEAANVHVETQARPKVFAGRTKPRFAAADAPAATEQAGPNWDDYRAMTRWEDLTPAQACQLIRAKPRSLRLFAASISIPADEAFA